MWFHVVSERVVPAGGKVPKALMWFRSLRPAAEYRAESDELLVFVRPDAVPRRRRKRRSLTAVGVEHRIILLVDPNEGVVAVKIPSLSHLDAHVGRSVDSSRR